MNPLPSGLPVEVEDIEPLARFVLSSRYRRGNEENGWRVLHPAFIPDPYDDLSVSRVGNLPESEVETFGRPVAEKQNKTLYGAAVVRTDFVRSTTLKVESDEPPPRHANILRWPKESDPKEQKSKRQGLATELAAEARYVPIEDK